MKRILLLLVATVFAVACSGEKNNPEEKNVLGDKQDVVESPANSIGVPPKPETKGAYDFSGCKAKYKVRTEAYKECVRAKYPHVKFADEEGFISDPTEQTKDWCGKPKGQCPEDPSSSAHKQKIKIILDSLKKEYEKSKREMK